MTTMRGREGMDEIPYTQDFTVCPICDNAFELGDNIISIVKNAYPKNFCGGDPIALFHANCFLKFDGAGMDQSIPEFIEKGTNIKADEK